MTLYQQFIEDVTTGKQLSNEYVKLAIKRHLNDLESAKTAKYPYYFDAEAADRVIVFIKMLRHTDGEYYGQRFNLQPFQAFIVASLFGWKKKKNHKRRFRKAYVEIARKNGKSELAGAIAAWCLIKDEEFGGEIYTFANSKDQSKVVFKIAEEMIRQLIEESPKAKELINMSRDNLSILSTRCKMEPLAADSKLLDGRRPHVGIGDECHEFRDGKLVKVIETGMRSRLQSLLFLITTAGFNMYGFCYDFRKVCISILRGQQKNEMIFSIIFTLDIDDDWHDRKVWIKSNPNIGNAPYWDAMDEAYTMAITEGTTAEIEFLTKNLNVWTTTSQTYINHKIWMASCTSEFKESDLYGRPCWMGLDMSRTKDITAMILLFPPWDDDEEFKILCRFHCPEDGIIKRSKSDGVNYTQWVTDGYLNSIPGPTIDDDVIFNSIMEDNKHFQINVIEYDPRFAHQLVSKLEASGIKCSAFRQSSTEFTSPIQQIEAIVLKQLLNHNNNPILAWMNSNVLLKRYPNGGLMFDKERSTERIDGMPALAMALGGYLTDKEDHGPSKYESEGFTVISV